MLVAADFGHCGGQTASLLDGNFLVLNSFDICRLGRELINLKRPGKKKLKNLWLMRELEYDKVDNLKLKKFVKVIRNHPKTNLKETKVIRIVV